MRLLLDTHALIWWLGGNEKLPVAARKAIANADAAVFVSAASAWEIATKYRVGKLPIAARFAGKLRAAIASQGFGELAVTLAHAEFAGLLPGDHKDPFDRLLIAQALTDDFVLVSNERLFDTFGVARLW